MSRLKKATGLVLRLRKLVTSYEDDRREIVLRMADKLALQTEESRRHVHALPAQSIAALKEVMREANVVIQRYERLMPCRFANQKPQSSRLLRKPGKAKIQHRKVAKSQWHPVLRRHVKVSKRSPASARRADNDAGPDRACFFRAG